jgi:uncharacterized small protein (DUF1192 family)
VAVVESERDALKGVIYDLESKCALLSSEIERLRQKNINKA